MTSKKNFKEIETERKRGRKRFLERVQNDKEAKQEQEEALRELVRQAEEWGLYDTDKPKAID